ncbi:hypothetical protein N8I77_004819 [Diaporthe amygdali]|uniref:Uncharacterized protein n=1 Tax=Phomopsis amygdali TaxID=1214568 RepID=A0AAD9W877_PHOAM|nr:hypothetical protein N8I77_004819 [Diaporthe amygdali]
MVSTPPPSICQTPGATTHDTTQSNPHPSSPTFDSLPQPRAPNNSSSSHDTGNNTIETGIPQQSDPIIPPTTMEDAPSPQEQVYAHQMPEMARSDSSSASSVDQNSPQIVAPVPVRPRLPSRKSSGTIIVPRESAEAVEPTDVMIEPGDVRAMSPRRTSEDLEALGREARDELRRHAKALQESLLMIFNRIEAVKEEHDKLDSNNKFLQKYIGDLMSTSKITATSSSRVKK